MWIGESTVPIKSTQCNYSHDNLIHVILMPSSRAGLQTYGFFLFCFVNEVCKLHKVCIMRFATRPLHQRWFKKMFKIKGLLFCSTSARFAIQRADEWVFKGETYLRPFALHSNNNNNNKMYVNVLIKFQIKYISKPMR